MATEFIFSIQDKPGALASIAEVLSNKGINIDAVAGLNAQGTGLIRLIADDPDSAEEALTEAGIQHGTREVILLKLRDLPGEIARFSKALADEGVNMSSLYITMNRQQVVDCDNLAKAREIANKLGVLQE